jgi:hypothetical protein
LDLGRTAEGCPSVTQTQRQIEEHRQGEACVEVRDAAGRPCVGVAVWVEQETHAFTFGCVAPDLDALPEADRLHCSARLDELFTRIIPANAPSEPGGMRVDVPDAVHLGQFRLELDRLATDGLPLDAYVRGRSLGLASGADRLEEVESHEHLAAEQVAALYTLCFAHPAVRAIHWRGFWNGEEMAAGGGLLRLDFAPRRAFRYLHKLIGTTWHSRANGQTDRDGRFRFRGFFGDYRMVARVGEEPTTTALMSHRAGREPSMFVLSMPEFIRPSMMERQLSGSPS